MEQLRHWDELPHVVASNRNHAWNGEVELAQPPDWREQPTAEIEGHPIECITIIDPALEKTHYWGEIASNLCAIDIWIGEETDLDRGYATKRMQNKEDAACPGALFCRCRCNCCIHLNHADWQE